MKKLLFLAFILFADARLFADEFDSAGVKLHYTVHGAGEPVILIHGLNANGPLNWTMPGTTTALARRAQVFVLDCRGHGRSGVPSGEGEYGMQMVGDIGRLMDHLGLRSAHLIGYSMGAMITLKFTALHPERVRSATLGGMGWMENGAMFKNFAIGKGLGERVAGFGALLAGFAEFAVSEDAVKAIRVPMEVIIGEKDAFRHTTVRELLRIRPDLSERVIKGVNHTLCPLKPQFKAEVEAALVRHLGKGEK